MKYRTYYAAWLAVLDSCWRFTAISQPLFTTLSHSNFLMTVGSDSTGRNSTISAIGTHVTTGEHAGYIHGATNHVPLSVGGSLARHQISSSGLRKSQAITGLVSVMAMLEAPPVVLCSVVVVMIRNGSKC